MGELNFIEKLKIAFFNVKKHLNSIENKIEGQNKEISELKRQINEVNTKISDSIGKKGVFRQTDNRQTTDRQHKIDITSLKKDIQEIFRSLTDKEFTIFICIYQLEEELKRPINYSDISKKLSLSQSSVRSHVSELILKGAPIEKTKQNNRKVSLFIKKDFKSLNLASEILTFRQSFDNQTTLILE